MEELKETFFEKLIDKYGQWDRNSARFGTYSYGEIADDLSMSGSQFSKLLYGTATSGMYERTIKNIERLKEKESLQIKNKQLTNEVNQLKESLTEYSQKSAFNYKYLVFLAPLLIGLGYLTHQWLNPQAPLEQNIKAEADHFLDEFFERDFNSE